MSTTLSQHQTETQRQAIKQTSKDQRDGSWAPTLSLLFVSAAVIMTLSLFWEQIVQFAEFCLFAIIAIVWIISLVAQG